jgi:hypothetical protein
MSPDDAVTEDARRVAAIVNAMLVAKGHDPCRTAAGLLVIQELLIADEDIVRRVALAALLCEAAAKILSGAELEQLKDIGDRVRWSH